MQQQDEVAVSSTPLMQQQDEAAVSSTPLMQQQDEVGVSSTPLTQQQDEVAVSSTPLTQQQDEVAVSSPPLMQQQDEAAVSRPSLPACDGNEASTSRSTAAATSSGAPASSGGGGVHVSQPQPKCCDHCGRESTSANVVNLCAGCRMKRYCVSSRCQANAWRLGHKQECPLLNGRRLEARAARNADARGAAPSS
jgi:hypothetical protein